MKAMYDNFTIGKNENLTSNGLLCYYNMLNNHDLFPASVVFLEVTYISVFTYLEFLLAISNN